MHYKSEFISTLTFFYIKISISLYLLGNFVYVIVKQQKSGEREEHNPVG